MTGEAELDRRLPPTTRRSAPTTRPWAPTRPLDASPAGRVLLLAPSRGLGGGIERYVQTVQSAFDDAGILSRRLDLARSGPAGHRALLAQAAAALAATATPTRLVIGHRSLLPVAAILARVRKVSGISVICHGSDVWGGRWSARRGLENWLMGRPGVRLVAASSFTAGTLLGRGRAAILPPGLSAAWFSELVTAADQAPAGQDGDLEIMTAFRLAEWRDKGLPQLTAAIARLGRGDIRLTVCGSGEPPADLLAHVGSYPWCRLRAGLADRDLAARFARADLFVLATRTRPGPRPSGEGFGLVLLEAQVAGTAVVGPALGGSPDAYLDGVTGATPRDESEAALAATLDGLVGQPARLAGMGRRGGAWARERFAPGRYAELAIDRLL
ncbi:MAG TPA: glycosyltransferase family 4 protein [Trebonia sp.]|nr:glycosyltransferase family 4 protein [Trebonia sp.]